MKLNIVNQTKAKPYQIKMNNKFASLPIDEITINKFENLNDEQKEEKLSKPLQF